MVLWVIIGILTALFVFFIAPALLIFVAVFSRKKTVPFEDYNWERFKDHYYVPYLGRIKTARDFVQSHKKTEVSSTSYDGLTLWGDYYDLGFERTAILFHGFNAEMYTNLSAQGAFLMRQGFNVLFTTHRAHGKSEGRWSTIGIREQNDVLTWVRWAEEHGAKQILLYGVSMGAATVAFASDGLGGTRVRGMVIDSGFYSVYEQMKRDTKKMHIPRMMLPAQYLLAKLFLRVDIKTPATKSLEKTDVPALFIHGTNDETVLYQWGETNYNACASPKDILIVKDAPHTLSLLKDEAVTGETLRTFIERYFQ